MLRRNIPAALPGANAAVDMANLGGAILFNERKYTSLNLYQITLNEKTTDRMLL